MLGDCDATRITPALLCPLQRQGERPSVKGYITPLLKLRGLAWLNVSRTVGRHLLTSSKSACLFEVELDAGRVGMKAAL